MVDLSDFFGNPIRIEPLSLQFITAFVWFVCSEKAARGVCAVYFFT